jgi:hypothetical protein
MNKEYEMVIARYEEKMHWVDFLPEKEKRNYRITLSNSGGELEKPAIDNFVIRENYGREAGHYMNFIIENYDNLLDHTVFIQGNPWPHAEAQFLLEIFYGAPKFEHEMSFIGTNTPTCIPKVQRWSEAEHIIKSGWGKTPWPETKTGHNGIAWFIGGGAQFYVSKKLVHKRPKDHYERILKCAEDPDSNFAHVLEFHWPNVFDIG